MEILNFAGGFLSGGVLAVLFMGVMIFTFGAN